MAPGKWKPRAAPARRHRFVHCFCLLRRVRFIRFVFRPAHKPKRILYMPVKRAIVFCKFVREDCATTSGPMASFFAFCTSCKTRKRVKCSARLS